MARKILLADDSVTAQNMGRKILADAGYDVVTVNNGSAALKRITELKPDLIVLDVYMPGYSGLEVCQRLKDAGETAHIPVLLTVGKLEPFKPEEARRVRADAHIVKPFEASELLSAITRLEDRMSTHPGESGRGGVDSGSERFRSEGNSRKSESNPVTDTGWKSRLGFPPKKKKEEKEEPEDAAAGTFRDFRKGKSKPAPAEASTPKPAPLAPQPSVEPPVPPDITPEELDALSALAAKLDGPNSPAEAAAPMEELAHTTIPETAHETTMGSAETPPAEVAEAKAETQIIATAPEVPEDARREEHSEAGIPLPSVEPAALTVADPVVADPVVAAAVVEPPAFAVEGKSEIETQLDPVHSAAEGAEVISEPGTGPAPVEIYQTATEVAGTQHSQNQQYYEAPAPVIDSTVNAALLAQEPACVDQNDEPMFASATGAQERKTEVQTSSEQIASDAELVQALGLLTPSCAPTAAATEQLHGTPDPADQGQWAWKEAAHEGTSHSEAAGPRWIAEPVALSPEEAAISLEAEMFRTFAALPPVEPATAPGDPIEAADISGVSAIAAADENRLAAAEPAAAATAPEQAVESRSSEPSSTEHGSAEHVPPAETGLVEHGFAEPDFAEPGLTESGSTESAFTLDGSTTTSETSAAEALEEMSEAVAAAERPVAGPEAPQTDGVNVPADAEISLAKSAPPGLVETPAAATFADAFGQGEFETTAELNEKGLSETNPEAIVAAANQAEHGVAEALKAKAAAAAADSGASATDATTIASIVESVLANLRPKLVEEIAKKLAGK